MEYTDGNLSPRDITILQELFNSTNGPDWFEPWEFSDDCYPCHQFHGVICSDYVNDQGYYDIVSLYLGSGNLVGTVPESLYELSNLTSVGFGLNHLWGTLSSNVGLLSQLENYQFYSNDLTGSLPKELSTLPKLLYIDVSHNRLSGKLEHSFDPETQLLLNYIDLNSNEFTGTIPRTLASLPDLSSLTLNWNCLHGPIPESFCKAKNLRYLYLDAINTGPSCRYPFLTIAGSTSYLAVNKMSGEIPNCLFGMDKITAISMNGLGLVSTIPSTITTSSQLFELYLSSNALYGTIPSVLTDLDMDTLDLSYNRLSGTVGDHSGTLSPYYMVMTYNRLSGYIPGFYHERYGNTEMLEGNAFDCNMDRSDLPLSDPYLNKYQDCGSDNFNTTLYEALGVTMGSLMLLVLAFGVAKYSLPLQKCISQLQNYRESYTDLMSDTGYFKWNGFVRDWACILTAMTLVVLLPMYIALSAFYATQTYKYAWVVSGVYLNGVVATVCMLLVLLLLGGSVYWSIRRSAVSFAVGTSSYSMSECWNMAKIAWVLVVLLVVIIDFVLVISVNTTYIAVARLADEATIQKASIGMSVFKIVWNFLVLRSVLKVLTFKSPIKDFRIQQHWFANLETSLVLFNNILAPYIATLFASADCIQDALVRNSAYAFVYSYQCSSTFITTYASVFLFMFALTAVGFPVIQCSMMALHHAVYPARQENCVHRWMEKMLSIVQPKLLFPEISINVSNADDQQSAESQAVQLETIARSWERVLSKRLFCADLMVVDMVSMFAIMLTFGAVVPAVAVLGCCAVLSQSVFNELMIGRGIRKVKSMYGGAADAAEKISKFREELLLECRAFGDLFKLNMFICVPFVVVFYGLLVFDMLGDTEGSDRAIWAPVAVLCIVVGLTAAARYGSAGTGKRHPSYTPLLRSDDSVESGKNIVMTEGLSYEM